MAKKSILDQIESGERARLMLVASDQRDESSGFRGSDECRSLLAGAMHETRRGPYADVTLMLQIEHRGSGTLAALLRKRVEARKVATRRLGDNGQEKGNR